MHANPVTILWNAIAGIGVVFSLVVIPKYWTARRIARDKRSALDTQYRRDGVFLMSSYLWMEVSRLACHVISLALGVWYPFLPAVSQPDRPPSVDAYGLAFLLGIIAINCLTVGNSIRAFLAWRHR